MASNYQITLKNSQDRIEFLSDDLKRQIAEIDKEISEKERSRQSLMEVRAVLKEYERLLILELKPAV